MNTSNQRPSANSGTCQVGVGSRPLGFAAVMSGLLLLIGCFTPAPRLVAASLFPPAGTFRLCNESVARVKTLVFRNNPGLPKMDVTVASVKQKDAEDNFLQNLIGGLKGITVNLFLKPIPVEPAGNEAMLDFGRALTAEAPVFTFPRARNLKASGI